MINRILLFVRVVIPLHISINFAVVITWLVCHQNETVATKYHPWFAASHCALYYWTAHRYVTVSILNATVLFSVSLKVLSQGNLRRRSLQGPRSATTGWLTNTTLSSGFLFVYLWQFTFGLHVCILHDHPSCLCCPDALNMVGASLSGNGCGSPNHI